MPVVIVILFNVDLENLRIIVLALRDPNSSLIMGRNKTYRTDICWHTCNKNIKLRKQMTS